MLPEPILEAIAAYLQQLHSNPLRTKCISSCVIASSGSLLSQYMSGKKPIDIDNVIAYGLFGLLFGGPIPHWFFKALDTFIPSNVPYVHFKWLLTERILFAPLFQALALYMLAIFEGKSNKEAQETVRKMIVPVLKANWMYLTIPQLLNIVYVPPMLKSIANSLIAFCWIVYLANKRRQAQKRGQSRQ